MAGYDKIGAVDTKLENNGHSIELEVGQISLALLTLLFSSLPLYQQELL